MSTEPLDYMRGLPEGRRVFHCEKHSLYNHDCAPCREQFEQWQTLHKSAAVDHTYLEG